jgi:hypothetical protein
MTLFIKTQTEQLIANCQAQIVRMDNQQPDIDFTPVVKLFMPDAQCTWHELRDLRGPLGLPVERDLHFDADKTLSACPRPRTHRHLTLRVEFRKQR